MSSVFKVDTVKDAFLKKLEGQPPAVRQAATLAWNLVLANAIATIVQKIVKLTKQKAQDTLAAAKRDLSLDKLKSDRADLKNTVTNPTQKSVSGYMDPSIDILKKSTATLSQDGSRKEALLNTIKNRSIENRSKLDLDIANLNNSKETLEKLKI